MINLSENSDEVRDFMERIVDLRFYQIEEMEETTDLETENLVSTNLCAIDFRDLIQGKLHEDTEDRSKRLQEGFKEADIDNIIARYRNYQKEIVSQHATQRAFDRNRTDQQINLLKPLVNDDEFRLFEKGHQEAVQENKGALNAGLK